VCALRDARNGLDDLLQAGTALRPSTSKASQALADVTSARWYTRGNGAGAEDSVHHRAATQQRSLERVQFAQGNHILRLRQGHHPFDSQETPVLVAAKRLVHERQVRADSLLQLRANHEVRRMQLRGVGRARREQQQHREARQRREGMSSTHIVVFL